MKITIRFFAAMAQQLNTSSFPMHLGDGRTLADALRQLRHDFPALHLPTGTLIAINQQYAAPNDPLHNGDEVALIPPVSGGSSPPAAPLPAPVSIRISPDPFDIAEAIAALAAPDAGGIDLFLGITRPEISPDHGPLLFLEYHSYEQMAIAEMNRLADRARARWPILRAILWHRVGRVAMGEVSVIIAVACPHRSEAFESCRFLIDELKKTVPIWKKEIFATDAQWQSPP